jgi:hypothetical protein
MPKRNYMIKKILNAINSRKASHALLILPARERKNVTEERDKKSHPGNHTWSSSAKIESKQTNLHN